MKKVIAVIFALIFAVAALDAVANGWRFGQPEEETVQPNALRAYYEAIDVDYALGVAEAMSSFGTNLDLGFRTAGSPAELAAAEYLRAEMVSIGLKNVHRDLITVDTWTFSQAEMTIWDEMATEQTITLAAYAATYRADREAGRLVYAGKGTAAELEAADAAGSFVLIDIDPDTAWGVQWPAVQAKQAGAKAVIAINDGGFGQFGGEALYVGNLSGPSDAPVFSITKRDGDRLKRLIQSAEDRSIAVTLTVDNQVARDGEAYTVIGEIPGTAEEVIYVAGHYDGYFQGFDDNASGIGAMMGIAKALIDSGYTPEKTIRFVAHPAAEWGLINSRYDQALGAYRTLEKNAQWAEDAFALINLDGGVASANTDHVNLRSSWTLNFFAMETGWDVEWNPFDAMVVHSPSLPGADDFVYALAGIPVISSGSPPSLEQDRLWENKRHSSRDTKEDGYNADMFYFSHRLYGTYVIKLDQLPVMPLDFVDYFEALLENLTAVDRPGSESAADFDALIEAVKDALEAAKNLTSTIERTKWTAEDAQQANRALRRIYAAGQQGLLSMDWGGELIYAHERLENNTFALQEALDALRRREGANALEMLRRIDLNAYADAFDQETVQRFVRQVLGPDARNVWGEGLLTDHVDVYNIMQSIQTKMEPVPLEEELGGEEAQPPEQETAPETETPPQQQTPPEQTPPETETAPEQQPPEQQTSPEAENDANNALPDGAHSPEAAAQGDAEAQANADEALRRAAEALRNNDASAALEALRGLESNASAHNRNQETAQFVVNQLLGANSQDLWGGGVLAEYVDVYNVLRIMQGQMDAGAANAGSAGAGSASADTAGAGTANAGTAGTADALADAPRHVQARVWLAETRNTRTRPDAESTLIFLDEMDLISAELFQQQRLLSETVRQMTRDVMSMTRMMDQLSQ